VLEETNEGLGSVVKLGSCLRSHNSNAAGDDVYKLCSKNWKQGVFFLYFFSYFGNPRQVGLSNKNKTKCGLLFVACTTISNAIEERNKSYQLVLEINRKWGFSFSGSLFLSVQLFPEVDVALWYKGRRAQKYEVKTFSRVNRNRGNGKTEEENSMIQPNIGLH
jgi:hypothetical protein